VRELAAPFDTVSVCLSKGLGAPVGSLLAGTRELVARARRRRKMMGGGMRQAGILAAAGLHALDHHVERLADDHTNATHLAAQLLRMSGARLDRGGIQTNIVVWDLAADVSIDAARFVERAKARGVLLNAMGVRRLRAVSHLGVDAEACARAGEVCVEILREATTASR
jgi:threonine aldolase